ncbi:MAG TPA: hypothetical protein VKQ08_11590, partial [Cyclobacteriaceae bacterium]|nr:hypothetical protein [Cyclobacteriaceae bacterium]
MIKLSALLLSFLLAATCLAQDYHFEQYRVEDGLPSDIVKACIQDSLGYFWIATDDGLVKYDGIKFTTYREPLHSGYTKGFIRLRNGRLFTYGDFDFVEVRNLGDTVIFRPILFASRTPDDHTLSYPKSIYEDSRGDLWISEPQSVVKLHGNYFKRFSFDMVNRSPQFLRSFTFFEDRQNNLVVTSFQGTVYYFDPTLDEFEKKEERLPFGIEHISVVNNQLLIGCSTGFFESPLLENGGFGPVIMRLGTPLVSFIAPMPNQKYFVATRGTKQFLVDAKGGPAESLPYEVNNVNHVYVSRDRDIWLSGNDGLILLKENLFHQASKVKSEFIEAITEDPGTGKIFYATMNTLYAFEKSGAKNTA